MASKNIGKEINGFLVLDSRLKQTKNSRYIVYKVKCLKCGEVAEKGGDSILKGHAACHNCNTKYRHHKQSGTRIYNTYHSMLARCYKKNNNRYAHYGAKGIEVCDEWRSSFEAFYKWAMANGYADDLTIDRRDVNRNYEPDNCRWVSMCEQMNNTTRNHYLEYNGKRQTVAQWAKETGLSYATVNQRINKLHWSVERALTTPARNQREAV